MYIVCRVDIVWICYVILYKMDWIIEKNKRFLLVHWIDDENERSFFACFFTLYCIIVIAFFSGMYIKTLYKIGRYLKKKSVGLHRRWFWENAHILSYISIKLTGITFLREQVLHQQVK